MTQEIETYITPYTDTLKVLKTNGSKVALQTIWDGPYIFAEKSDFIATIRNQIEQYKKTTPTDYDGNSSVFTLIDNVVLVPCGII